MEGILTMIATFIIGFLAAIAVMCSTIIGTIILAAYTPIPQLWCITVAIAVTASAAGLANAVWCRLGQDID